MDERGESDRYAAKLTRRSALVFGASVLAAWCVSGCGAVGRYVGLRERGGSPAVRIGDADEALAYALDELETRHGEAFHFVSSYGEPYDAGNGRLGYDFCLAPDAQPERFFTAMMGVAKDTGELIGTVNSNYSQWLFKERVETPFREVLAADPGVVGYAAVLFYARLDSRQWSEDELEEYMGRGGSGDPRVDVVAMVGREAGSNETAQTAKRVQDALWELGISMRLSVVRAGDDPYRSWLYSTDSAKQLVESRGVAPSLEEIQREVELCWGSERHPWDGTGDAGDPAYGATRPSVTWKDGVGA